MMREIIEVASQKVLGPSISFTSIDVLRAVELIVEKGPIGRQKLSQELGMGEGATRTLIKRLEKSGLIVKSKLGCKLTKKGEEMWRTIKAILPVKFRLGRNKLSLAPNSVAVLVKGLGEKIKDGLEERDASVKAGAKGATTIVYKNGYFSIPKVSLDISKDYPDIAKKLIKITSPEEKDAVIIASGNTAREAENGAYAAVLTLLNKN